MFYFYHSINNQQSFQRNIRTSAFNLKSTIINQQSIYMNQEELKNRTKKFTIAIIRFVKSLPEGRDAWILGDQLYRAGSSVGSNYRAACRSKTRATFIHKLGIVEEESDECCFWLEICLGLAIGDKSNTEILLKEANELTSIFTSSNITLSKNQKK